MSTNRKKLERDSDLYQEAIRTRTINNMNNSSKVVKILDARHSYTYQATIKHTGVWNTVYKSRDNLYKNQLNYLDSIDPVSRAKNFGKEDTCPDSDQWKAFGDIEIELEMKIRVELPDNEEIDLIVYKKVNKFKDIKKVGHLYNIASSDTNVDVTVNDEDEYIINIGNYSYHGYNTSDSSNSFNLDKSNYSKTEKFLIFCSNKKRWIQATIKDPLTEDGTIIIPVNISSEYEDETDVSFRFNNPNTNDKLWGLVEQLDVGEPMMISGENIYLSHRIISNEGLIDDSIWYARTDRPSKIMNIPIINRIKSIF